MAYVLAPVRDGAADWTGAAEVCTAPLTPRRAAVLEYVDEYTLVRGFGPSLREVGEAVGLKRTPSAVAYHIRHLERAGLLARDHGVVRSTRVTAGRVMGRGCVA